MNNEGRVLIVDDNKTSRLKLGLAIRKLGFERAEAEDGLKALEILRTQDFDLILLDIVMPEMSGFDVLKHLKADRRLREIPVLVISSMDDDMASVAKAIELGAEDFLPKTFDPVLLRARVQTCIERKKHRDLELDYLSQVEKLSDAATVMEGGKFHPKKLKLEVVAARSDALGRLARVFGDMAEQVYERERSLQQNIRTLRGGLMLIVVGTIWGLMVPLSRLISRDVPQATGVSFWTNLIAGLICCAWAAAHGKFSRINRQMMAFIAIWAVLNVGSSILLFVVAGQLPGIIISILIALEGFAVFLFAAVMRIEEPTLRRFAGLALGLCAVLALIMTREGVEGVSDWVWVVLALGVPLLYAAADLLVAARHPADLEMTTGMGLVLLASATVALPIALASGQFFLPDMSHTKGHILILFTGFLLAVGNVAYVLLISLTGAVFASQSAYAITIAGIAWSILLLGETLTVWSFLALALIIFGLMLVGAKNEAGDVEVEFRRRPKRIT